MRTISNKAYKRQLALAIKNDQNVARARQGIKAPLPRQVLIEEPTLDPVEIRTKAYNHLLSVLGPGRAEAFLAGQTTNDLQKINIYWRDLQPVLANKIGLTKTFFDKIINKI